MILDFGYVCMEILAKTKSIPQAGQSSNGLAHTLRISGSAASTAIAAARMGARVSLCGAVGNDQFAKIILARLQREGINPAGLSTHDTLPTGLVQTIMDKTGQTAQIITNGANARLNAAQIPLQAINTRTLLLLHDDTDATQNTALLARAKNAGARCMMLAKTMPEQNMSSMLDYIVLPPATKNSPTEKIYTPAAPASDLALEIYCGSLAAALQTAMPRQNAENYANAAATLTDPLKNDPYPYLGDIEEKIKPEHVKTNRS